MLQARRARPAEDLTMAVIGHHREVHHRRNISRFRACQDLRSRALHPDAQGVQAIPEVIVPLAAVWLPWFEFLLGLLPFRRHSAEDSGTDARLPKRPVRCSNRLGYRTAGSSWTAAASV